VVAVVVAAVLVVVVAVVVAAALVLAMALHILGCNGGDLTNELSFFLLLLHVFVLFLTGTSGERRLSKKY
jgi:hypothetical protein